MNILDNRDQGTTWIWIDDIRTTPYVEVNPIELYENMIENCYNEDVLFLFSQFQEYLEELDENPDIKDDTDTDHIVGFRDFLNRMIETSASSRG